MFSKVENGAHIPFRSLSPSPHYVASTSQTHAPSQLSVSELPPQARVQAPSPPPPTRALISSTQQTSQFLKTENGTLTPLQSLSPHFVASSSQTHAPSQVSVSEPPQARVQPPSQTLSAPATRAVQILMHKSDLNSHCQKLGIPLPVYDTKVEGYAHEMRFRSTVNLGERSFASPNTFSNKKSAEQDVAKLAFECLLAEKEAWSEPHREDLRKLVCRDLARCKSILNEFAVKIKAECTYETEKVQEVPPVFVSYVKINGNYKDEGGKGKGKSKKEAEQEAALRAILSFLGDPAYAAMISKTLDSKFNCAAAFYEANEMQASKRSRV